VERRNPKGEDDLKIRILALGLIVVGGQRTDRLLDQKAVLALEPAAARRRDLSSLRAHVDVNCR
jgi:hypothetical protein